MTKVPTKSSKPKILLKKLMVWKTTLNDKKLTSPLPSKASFEMTWKIWPLPTSFQKLTSSEWPTNWVWLKKALCWATNKYLIFTFHTTKTLWTLLWCALKTSLRLNLWNKLSFLVDKPWESSLGAKKLTLWSWISKWESCSSEKTGWLSKFTSNKVRERITKLI